MPQCLFEPPSELVCNTNDGADGLLQLAFDLWPFCRDSSVKVYAFGHLVRMESAFKYLLSKCLYLGVKPEAQ